MPDTTTPTPDIPAADPLFNKALLLSLFPGILPVDAPASMTTVLTTLLNDIIDAANKAGAAGATPMLVLAPLKVMSMICYDAAKWVVDDYNQAVAALAAPAPPPAPTTPPPSPAPGPAPSPAPAPITEAVLELVNGVSVATLKAGDDVTLTVGALTTPDADMQVLAIALDQSAEPVTYPAYSMELKHTAHDGFTYTAGTLWPGITLYGKQGDLLRLTIGDTSVTGQISQDGGATWTVFLNSPSSVAAPLLYAHVATTANAAVNSVTARVL